MLSCLRTKGEASASWLAFVRTKPIFSHILQCPVYHLTFFEYFSNDVGSAYVVPGFKALL